MSDIVIADGVRERAARLLGRRPFAVAATGLIAVVVIGGGLGRVRATSATVAPPALAPSPQADVSAIPAATLFVHVAGAVRRPGLYELPAGARVADAIAAAGGQRRGAQSDLLNLAQQLTDGLRIEVPPAGADPVQTASPSTGGPSSVSLNSADQAALETIPGVGPVTAGAILEYRASIGSFSSVDQLLEVSGIGPATLESLRPYISL